MSPSPKNISSHHRPSWFAPWITLGLLLLSISISAAEGDLIGYWRMDDANLNGTITDASGNGNHATAYSFASPHGRSAEIPPTAYTTSASRSFDGVDDFVVVPMQMPPSFTFSCWFKADRAGLIMGALADDPKKPGAVVYSVADLIDLGADGTITFTLSPPFAKLGTVTLGTWNHVALTYDKATNTMVGYLNGVGVSVPRNPYGLQAPFSTYTFFSFGGGEKSFLAAFGDPFRGHIAECRMYASALPANQVAALANAANQPPWILSQPKNQDVGVGGPAVFHVQATGARPLSYQWRKDGSPISGATSESYTRTTAAGDDGAAITVAVSNSQGTTVSDSALLRVFSAPQIVGQPAPQSGLPGQTVTFSLTAVGAGSPSYQWQQSRDHGGQWSDIAGAQGNAYTTGALTLTDDSALFRCRVNNTIVSNPALLTVTPRFGANLMGYWKLDENHLNGVIEDSSGRGNAGVAHRTASPQGPVTDVPGTSFYNPRSRSFDGVDDYFIATVPTSNSFSVAFWFKAAQPGAIADAVTADPLTTAGPWGMDSLVEMAADGTIFIRFFPARPSLGKATLGTWNHVAFVFNKDDGSITGYLNGTGTHTPRDKNYGIPPVYGAFSSFAFGGGINTFHPSFPPPMFRGLIDDVRFYDGIVSAAEIASLISAPPPPPPPPAPTVVAVSPVSGSTDGGTVVTITGTHFKNASTVTFGDLAASVTFVNSTTLTAVTPARAAGTVSVTVTNAGEGSATLANSFTYVAPPPPPPAPTVASISPASGGTEGGIDAFVDQLVDRLHAPGYKPTYPDEMSFEIDVWPRVVALARHIGFDCFTSHTVHSDRSAGAWEAFSRESNGPDVKVLGANNRLDIVLRERAIGSIGIEVKCLGARGHSAKLTEALGQAVLGLANRDRTVVLLHCGTVSETERTTLRDIGGRICDKSRVRLVVVP